MFARVRRGGLNKSGVKVFLCNNNSGVIFVSASAKEFEVVR